VGSADQTLPLLLQACETILTQQAQQAKPQNNNESSNKAN
jgi:hypothetical protein